MTDREKVIKGCELLKDFLGDGLPGKRIVFNSYINIVNDAIDMLKEQKSEWLEDSDPGQEYGTTWACAECGCSIHKRTVWNPYNAGFKYCPFCGDRMVLKRDD